MRYIALAACFLVLTIASISAVHAQTDTPIPTDTPVPTDTSTPGVTPTETETPTAIPDFVMMYDLGNGKSGEVIYIATAGDIALIALWIVILITVLVLLLTERRQR